MHQLKRPHQSIRKVFVCIVKCQAREYYLTRNYYDKFQ